MPFSYQYYAVRTCVSYILYQRSDSCFYATYRAFINCFSSSMFSERYPGRYWSKIANLIVCMYACVWSEGRTHQRADCGACRFQHDIRVESPAEQVRFRRSTTQL